MYDLEYSHPGYVPRSELVKKMLSISTKKHIYKSARGGYGKSIAAAQWLSSVRGRTAKIIAGSADNDPGVFYKKVAEALIKLTSKAFAVTDKKVTETIISFDRLIEYIHSMPKKSVKCYLVIDDLHMLQSEEIVSHMPLIMSRLPDYVRLCLVSRSKISDELAKTEMFELIGENELLFSVEETEWLALEKNKELSMDKIKELQERAGGWAMYLSTLLSDSDTDGAAFDKNDTPLTLLQYLDIRVFRLWDEDTQNTLLKLAVPDEITPELCSRLTGRPDGHDVLEKLAREGNSFLSLSDNDTYRFHDIFREFLLERINKYLGADEVYRLNEITGARYYETGDYFAGARHYINNVDYDGINRCLYAINNYNAENGGVSVEARFNFIRQYIMKLSEKIIIGNPFLYTSCTVAAFHGGDTETFLRYSDFIHNEMPQIISTYPQLLETVTFINGLDFRVPIKNLAVTVDEKMRSGVFSTDSKKNAHSFTITQNLPFFHRSMRDYSEYYELCGADLTLLENTYGNMIGEDFKVMKPLITGGIHYEKGELLEASILALASYNECKAGMHPESFFSSHAFLGQVLYCMGSLQESSDIMEKIGKYVEKTAQFLYPNFMALQTQRAICDGGIDEAREWLAVYAYTKSGNLPFYQLCRHFTTLRSYIAVKDYTAAIVFGERLYDLADRYRRPLDQIESGLLMALAFWYGGNKRQAVSMLKKAADIAMPYGFKQLFINEGKKLLPILLESRDKEYVLGGDTLSGDALSKDTLSENTSGGGALAKSGDFINVLLQDICKKHNIIVEDMLVPKLTARQNIMLSCLNKGLSYNEIAAAIGIEHSTVKYHVSQMYKRMGVRDSWEAVMKAKVLGILK
ncbi:MAG: LuxR C-terminal-related transcriptional regulator [Oscillospiraceae bacterium]|nr:LuxR C-terminal-related transcriptional regulator [Oscillospiraceae bacterium]